MKVWFTIQLVEVAVIFVQANRLERGLVKEEALGDAEDMENLFQEAGQNEALLTNAEALQQANLAVIRNIPPYDISANTPQGAYPLDKLIISEEWEHLDVHELKLAAKKANEEDALRQKKTYPNFVLSRLRRIRVEVRIAVVLLLCIAGEVNLGILELSGT